MRSVPTLVLDELTCLLIEFVMLDAAASVALCVMLANHARSRRDVVRERSR